MNIFQRVFITLRVMVFFTLSLHDHSTSNIRKGLKSSETVNRKTSLKILVEIQEDENRDNGVRNVETHKIGN